MRIASGVEMLEVVSPGQAGPQVCPTLFYDERKATLVDTGFPGQLPMLKEAVEKVLPFDRITRIIITHQDIDHIGNLPLILAAPAQKIEVLCGAADRPYIEGEKMLIKGDPKTQEKRLALIPPERREALLKLMQNPPKAPVDRTLADGEELDGLVVIATPGHTPGHICLYHQPSKTLVAGDALRVVSGRLVGPAEHNAHDINEARRSLKKLEMFPVATVICYHGGRFRVPEGTFSLAGVPNE